MLGAVVASTISRALHWAFVNPQSRQVIWAVLALVGLIVISLSCAVMGAGAFTRERETGTCGITHAVAADAGRAARAASSSPGCWPAPLTRCRCGRCCCRASASGATPAMATRTSLSLRRWRPSAHHRRHGMGLLGVGHVHFVALPQPGRAAVGWTLATLFFVNAVRRHC